MVKLFEISREGDCLSAKFKTDAGVEYGYLKIRVPGGERIEYSHPDSIHPCFGYLAYHKLVELTDSIELPDECTVAIY